MRELPNQDFLQEAKVNRTFWEHLVHFNDQFTEEMYRLENYVIRQKNDLKEDPRPWIWRAFFYTVTIGMFLCFLWFLTVFYYCIFNYEFAHYLWLECFECISYYRRRSQVKYRVLFKLRLPMYTNIYMQEWIDLVFSSTNNIFLIFILLVIFSTLFDCYFEEHQLNESDYWQDYFLFFLYFTYRSCKYVWPFYNTIYVILCMFKLYSYKFYLHIKYLLNACKILLWRPFFKKQGYLRNFFKKFKK